MSDASTVDVIVVGAGPTGLLLAGDLAAGGVRTLVLERRPVQDQNLTRAFAVHARTLEVLDSRGLADELIASGTKVQDIGLFGSLSLDFSTIGSRFPYLLVVPQYRTEEVLARRAAEQGARMVRGAEVADLRQSGDQVSVRTVDGTEYRASYLVGADGVHSTVRERLGLPYPGESVVRSVMLADVRLRRQPGSTLTLGGAGDSFAFVVPFGDGWYRVVCWNRDRQLPDDTPVDLSEVAEAMRRALSDDYGVHDPRGMSRFHSDERQVPSYREGRVLLAGDAAHCHSPAGGLGMNTGLQDAANLGWKLAATVRGEAPAWLLDSYHGERYPVGRTALRLSGALVRNALMRSRFLREARAVVAGLLVRVAPVRQRLLGMVSGLGIRYPAPRGSHAMTGRRMPDIPLADDARYAEETLGAAGVERAAAASEAAGAGHRDGAPARLYEALRDGRFVLVGAEVPTRWRDRVLGVRAVERRGPVTLVRPDGYVAWAGVNAHRLPEALGEWLGAGSAG